jgi:CubicO group peptidase (beta-lactamase class C family)
MVLIDRKRLDLDRPINDCLGDAKVRARAGDASTVTLRRVAQHTAGLPGYYETFYPDEPDKPPTPDGMILRYGFTSFPPGDHFHYSNLGYALLGEAVARASGKDFGDFLREEVFLPLGMHRSAVRLGPALKRHRAIRYGLGRERLPDYVTPHAPASDIYASAHDLARFGMFHMKLRLTDQKRILSEAAIDDMRRSPVPMGDEEYGIGWHMRKDAKGRRHVLHGGAAAGVDALLTLIPGEDLCVAVLANVTGGTELTRGISDRILAMLLGGEVNDVRPAPRPARREAGTLRGELKGRWAGSVHTHRREIAVTLWFQESGDVHARLGDQLKTLVNDPRLGAGSFTGKMAGDIETAARTTCIGS